MQAAARHADLGHTIKKQGTHLSLCSIYASWTPSLRCFGELSATI